MDLKRILPGSGRGLLLLAAACGAAVAASAETKVGIIGLDTSHAIAFTRIMNVAKDPGVAGFRVTHAYQWGSKDIVSATNRYPKYLAQVKEMGVEVVPTIDELIASVDCICLETNDGREHLWQAEKVFASGKPCFIDKPLAHNLHDAVRIYDLGKRLGAKWFSSSALRYGKAVQDARAGVYGKIRTVALTSPAPEESQGTHGLYSWYGIHGFEPYVTVMGTGAEKVSCFRSATDDAVNVAYADGRMGQLHLLRDAWTYSGYILPVKVKDPKNPVVIADGYPGYEPLLRDIVKFFKTGVASFPPEETLEIFALMEAAETSAKRGGAPVALAEVLAAARAPDCGLTFDFAAISRRRFPAGTGEALEPSGWKGDYCHVHSRDVAPDDPRRAAVRKAVRWTVDGDELVVAKGPDLRKACRDEALADCVSGGWSRRVRLSDASGGVYRVSLYYRLKHDVGGRGWVLATPAAGGVASTTGAKMQVFDLAENGGDFIARVADVRVPAGCDALDLVVRFDGVGELRFRDVCVTRMTAESPITLKALPADYFDGTFAFPAGQCGLPVWRWKKNDPDAKYDPASITFVLTLPKGYSLVDTVMGRLGETRARPLDGGATEYRIPAEPSYAGCRVQDDFNGWSSLNALVRADADAPRGTMRFHAECGGVRVSDVSETTVFTVPALKAEVPRRYVNGFYPGGNYAAFPTEAGREGFAEMFTAAGARWVVQMRPDDATLAAWRRRGVKYVTPEASDLASNGFRIGDAKSRPADERFVSLPGVGDWAEYRTLAACPIAVYTESEHFRRDTLPKLRELLRGCDGFWANWEPFMFDRRGCMCERCRAAFARFVGVTDGEMARDWPQELAFGRKWHEKSQRFRSLEHAKVVKTLDKWVRSFTGGADSLGFIPGVSWSEMASSWRPLDAAPEVRPFDYAGSLKWINPWGPYPWWDASSPYVPTDCGDLAYFLVAKDVREQVDRDYGAAAPKLMSFPHGVQLGTCLTQPESVALALDAFFFNRWESSVLYAFPKGYDARYWRAFAEATTRAARYEDVVWDGERCDARIALERDAAAPYPPNAKAPCPQQLPSARDVPLLQHAAYRKGGRLVVAVFNFARRDAAVFRLRFAARRDMTLDGRRVSAAELRAGVPLAVPAARCRVFEFVVAETERSEK